jgi:photosystem II stability/assembly factor-like uncharacterized protein
MSRLRFATSVVTTVLATLVVAAIAYGGAANLPHRTAAVPHPVPASKVSPLPSSTPPATNPPAGFFAIDEDMVGASAGWMLLSDCPLRASDTCHYAAAETLDGGGSWTRPVQVGPFSPGDGGAPRAIRFLNRRDGFVYGAKGAYVTHDGGASWRGAGLPPGFIGSIAVGSFTVWATYYPCAKGTFCAYEVRSSTDGGRTWSAAHKLPLNFSPDLQVAFGSGVILSSVPTGDIEMTSDAVMWRTVKSACVGNPFRGYATTADGNELWELCLGYPSSTGEVTDRSLFVSDDGGKSWSPRSASDVAGSVSAWIVPRSPQVALTIGNHATLVTHDGGRTWSSASPENLVLARIFVLTPEWGWAMDTDRNVWETSDGGDHWNRVGALPGRLS